MAQISSKKKKAFLEAYKRLNGNISAACKSVNIPRRTYYNWIKKEGFVEEVEDAYESTIDWVENKLLKQVEADNITAIIFYLKTKGQKRGYIEKQKLEIEGVLSQEEMDAQAKLTAKYLDDINKGKKDGKLG